MTMWAQACESLRTRIGEQNYTAWIAPLRCTWVDDDVMLEAPDRLTRELVGRHFTDVIAEAVAAVAGRRCTVRVELPAVPGRESGEDGATPACSPRLPHRLRRLALEGHGEVTEHQQQRNNQPPERQPPLRHR